MIKFFRHIRQNLLMENRTGKYLKYAIGEIVLVVIGILIALQINNWNEERKINLEEKRALENIYRDFIKNRESLQSVMRSTQRVLDAGLNILNHTGNKEKPSTETIFNDWLNEIYNCEPYYPQNGFLDDLLSSGKLGIFKNIELRSLLSSWKPKVDILSEGYKSQDKNEDLLNLFILENASWLNADQIYTKQRNIDFPVSGFDVDNRNLLTSLHFENLVENTVISADVYYTVQSETLGLLNQIIAVLETEIENSGD
jgi:hypothetical protein